MITQQDVQHVLIVVGALAYAFFSILGMYIGIDEMRNGGSHKDTSGCGWVGLAMFVFAVIVLGIIWYNGLPATRAQ